MKEELETVQANIFLGSSIVLAATVEIKYRKLLLTEDTVVSICEQTVALLAKQLKDSLNESEKCNH